MRKTKDVEIFGKKLKLSERNASDVIALTDYASESDFKSLGSIIYLNTKILEASLVYNYDDMRWHQYFQKRKLKKLLSFKNLINKLPQSEIFTLAEQVLELEGLLVKKTTTESAEKKTKD